MIGFVKIVALFLADWQMLEFQLRSFLEHEQSHHP